MNRLLQSACVVALGMAVYAAPASAVTNLVINGDFEITDGRTGNGAGGGGTNVLSTLAGGTGGGSWSVYDALPDGLGGDSWVKGATTSGIEVQTDATVTTINARSGDHYIELDSESEGGGLSNSSMSQEVTGLEGGKTYVFSFWYSPRVNCDVTHCGDTNLIDWLIEPPGAPEGAGSANGVLPGSVEFGEWTEFTSTFLWDGLDGDMTTITFTAGGRDDEHGGFIDDVALQVIPLPAGSLLIFGAFAAAGAVRRFGRA